MSETDEAAMRAFVEESDDWRATARSTESGRVTSVCSVCGDSVEAPNKGMGRAVVAAWESNHGRNCGRDV